MRNEENGISSHPYCSDVSRCRVYRGSHSYDCVCYEQFLSVTDIVRDTGVSLLFFRPFCKFDIETEKWYIKNRIEEVLNQAPEYISIANQVIRKAEPVCCACDRMTNEKLDCGLFLFAHSFERLCVGHSSPRYCARWGEGASAPAEGYFSGEAWKITR